MKYAKLISTLIFESSDGEKYSTIFFKISLRQISTL